MAECSCSRCFSAANNHTKKKCSSSVVEMASGGDKTEIEDAPAAQYRSAVWGHFGFGVTYEAGKKIVDKSATVCKHCSTRVIYAAGNTSNMLTHMKRHHPTLSLDSTKRRGTEQLLLPAAFKLPLNDKSDKAKAITEAVGCFIAKDMQPYAVVEGVGF